MPVMNYIAVRGKGDPNEEGGEYKDAIGVLYAIAYTIKMSKMGDHRMEGYFDFVVPPLEGFWWQEDIEGVECVAVVLTEEDLPLGVKLVSPEQTINISLVAVSIESESGSADSFGTEETGNMGRRDHSQGAGRL